jgi:hypothetical protein
MSRVPKNYFIYETSYGSDIPINQIFAHSFDALPSMYRLNRKYNLGLLNLLIKKGFTQECEIRLKSKRTENDTNEILLINNKKQIAAIVKVYNLDNQEPHCEIIFHYSLMNGDFDSQFNLNELKDLIVLPKKSGINLVKSDHGHLDTEEYDLNVPDIDIELNYGTEFVKVHETIVKRLNKPSDKGIILFHGDPGTGKTSYIKYLTRLIENKEILFIPPSMAESLSEPSIIPFLMEHKNSILIIEDAEKVISDREMNGSSAGVSNILNLTDGILGDCLNIQIVATFNMKREKIDPALLRKGRLIAEHKFGPLTIENSNRLLKQLGSKKTVDKPMCLADIYNIDEDVFKVDNKQQIGFKN